MEDQSFSTLIADVSAAPLDRYFEGETPVLEIEDPNP